AIQLRCRAGPTETRSSAAHNLANVIQEVDRLEARVKDLFQFVEPTKQRQQRLDLNSIVSGVLQMMAGRLNSGDVKLIEHLTPGLPPITGDALLLQPTNLK